MKRVVFFLSLICVFLLPHRVDALDNVLAEGAKSSILIEASTGNIIYENNSHEKRPPASMTKMMSMLLIVESIDKGDIKWNDMVTVSENAASMGGSQILLETNEKMSVSDLFKGIAVASGNDAVVAMAEYIAGTEDNFVKMMNEKAQQLGLKDTSFKNPHGLDAEGHYTSAYDMAMIAKELVKHEQVFKYTSIYEDYLRKGTDREIWLVNTNKLVRFYDGVDGLKTGYTKEAGYCLTATAKKDGMRLIAVVMGEESPKNRNKDVTDMLNYGFNQYHAEGAITKGTVLGKIEVEKGKKKYVDVITKEDVSIINKKSSKKKKVSYDLKLNKVHAPIKKNAVVGKAIIIVDGKKKIKVDVIAKEAIEKANLWQLYTRYLADIFKGEINFK
jgi:D-alanyl-D-alanine carboxypeptidase (penicillin-binding protein 5/6)